MKRYVLLLSAWASSLFALVGAYPLADIASWTGEGDVEVALVVAWNDGRPERVPGTEETLPAQLVLVACGFTGPETTVLDAFDIAVTGAAHGRARPQLAEDGYRCIAHGNADGSAIFACGDARTGSSLVVSAIADAIACAQTVAKALDL